MILTTLYEKRISFKVIGFGFNSNKLLIRHVKSELTLNIKTFSK